MLYNWASKCQSISIYWPDLNSFCVCEKKDLNEPVILILGALFKTVAVCVDSFFVSIYIWIVQLDLLP